MDFRINILKGANDVEFGMRASKVRSLIGGKFKQFRRSSEIHPSDHCFELGVFCYYDSDGLLEALEFHSPARVFLGEINLLSLTYSQIVPLLKKLDPHIVTDMEGVGSKRLSLGFYIPDLSDEDEGGDDAHVETVLVGRPGYCDYLDDPKLFTPVS